MIEQRTDEWRLARCGKVTSSRVAEAVARTKTGWGAAREVYAAFVIAERLSGVPIPQYVSGPMRWGAETEAEAREAYTFRTDLDVYEVGFIDHPTIAMSGCSPDGFVNEVGLVEFKCPNTATHIKTLLAKAAPEEYLPQMHWQMACTGRQWCDFASYDPRMPESMRLFVQRVERDEDYITKLEADVTTFLAEVDQTVAELTAIYEPARFLNPLCAG